VAFSRAQCGAVGGPLQLRLDEAVALAAERLAAVRRAEAQVPAPT
jgi:hypothetical protein